MSAARPSAATPDARRAEQMLRALARFCQPCENLDALLDAAAHAAIDAFALETAAVVWIDEAAPRLRLRAQRPEAAPRSAGADHPAIACVACLREGKAGGSSHELALPLSVNGQTVGYLYARAAARGGARTPRANTIDVGQLGLFAMQLGLAIEAQSLRQLLASRYAPAALSRDGRDAQPARDAQFLEAVTHPEKVARIIARSFYKDLRRSGFETKQILVVASELIDNLNEALRRTRAKAVQSEAAADAGETPPLVSANGVRSAGRRRSARGPAPS